MRKLTFRPSAKDDLDNLYHYIAESSGSRETAIGYVRRIENSCRRLAAFPESGHRRDDLRAGLRILSFERRVVIAYTVLQTGDVEIGRVFYGGRDYEALVGTDESQERDMGEETA